MDVVGVYIANLCFCCCCCSALLGALPNKCKAMLNRNAGLDTDSTSPNSKACKHDHLHIQEYYSGCRSPGCMMGA